MSTALMFPPYEVLGLGTIGFGTITLNATTNDFGVVFQMPEAATITTIGWRQGTLTGTPGTLRVGLQGVSATTGANDGTYLGGSTNYVDYTGWSAGNNNLFVTHTLPTSVSLTQGQLVCLFLKPQAVGTWNASNNVTVTSNTTDYRKGLNRPYHIQNGAPSADFQQKVFLLRSSTKTYGSPIETFVTPTLTNTSNPDEVGLAFTLGSSLFSTYQVAGVRFINNIASAGSGNTFNVVLYNNTTALQTVSFDTDQATRFASNGYEVYFTDTTLATLNTGTEYILGQKATSAGTTSCRPLYLTAPTNGDLTAFTNQTIRYAERQTTGSWSFTNNTRLPAVSLIIKSTAFTGSGGMIVHPGMAGGMRS